MTADSVITAVAAIVCIALIFLSAETIKEEVDERKVVIDTSDGKKTCHIKDKPLADEWPAGDPVPADKETLGYVRRDNE